MEDRDNNSFNKSSITPWLVTILISAWLIAMGIIIAGWLISKQIAVNNPGNNIATTQTAKVDIEVPAGLPVLGDNNAPVTVIEFADFQCPYCGEWHKTIFPDLKSQYIDTGKVRFVYMDYAFLGQESYRAAEAARCANDQGKFWEYHDALYQSLSSENGGSYSDENLKKFAGNVGLDGNVFSTCLDGNTHQTAVADALQKGTQYGVEATPTVFINGFKYEGLLDYSVYATAIEEQLSSLE